MSAATWPAARALGMLPEIWSLEPGTRADLVLVRPDGLQRIPSYEPYSLLVYSTTASDVDTVVIGGRVVMAGSATRSGPARP